MSSVPRGDSDRQPPNEPNSNHSGKVSRRHKHTYDAIAQLAAKFSGQDKVLVIPRFYITLCGGDHLAALLLNQIIYWTDITTDKAGWFSKSYKDWDKELGMSQYQVKRAIEVLKPLGVETHLHRSNHYKFAPTLHYRVNMQVLSQSIMKFLHNPQLSRNSTIDHEETQQSNTESIAESTPESTKEKDISNASNSPLPEKPDTDTQLISDGKNTVAAQDASHNEVSAAADSTDTTPVKEETAAVKGSARSSKRKEKAIVHPDAAAAEPSPYYKPTQDERHAMFEAVCAHVFGVTDRDSIREMARGDHSRAGKIVSWLLRQNDAFAPNGSGKKVVVGLISAPANPQHVAQFAAAYKAKHRDASLPIDIVKFTDAWRAWGSEKQREAQRQQRQAQQAAARAADKTTDRATPEELAKIKAELELMKRQLKAEGSPLE